MLSAINFFYVSLLYDWGKKDTKGIKMNIQSTNRSQSTNFGAVKMKYGYVNEFKHGTDIPTIHGEACKMLSQIPKKGGDLTVHNTVNFMESLEWDGDAFLYPEEHTIVTELIKDKKFSTALKTLKDFFTTADTPSQEIIERELSKKHELEDKSQRYTFNLDIFKTSKKGETTPATPQ